MSRRFPPPWQVEQIPGGFKVLDANGQALAYVYARETQQQVDAAKVLTFDEARRIAVNDEAGPKMIAKVVMLYLTVYNCDTGAVLYQSTRQMPNFSISGDRIEDCRKAGVQTATALTKRFRHEYPHASSNVVCRWEPSPSQRA